jgi:hypothetical protein
MKRHKKTILGLQIKVHIECQMQEGDSLGQSIYLSQTTLTTNATTNTTFTLVAKEIINLMRHLCISDLTVDIIKIKHVIRAYNTLKIFSF